MTRKRIRNKLLFLAAATTGLCWAFGLGCLQDFAAIIGASFF